MAYRIFSLIIFYAINGCATYSPIATDADKVGFFEPSKDPRMAALFLACGKHMVNGGEPTFVSNKQPSCGFEINGINYSKLEWGQIGRVEVPGGVIAVDNIDGRDPIKNIQVLSGTSALLISSFNEIFNTTALLLGPPGALYDLATTDRSKLNGPLEIYTGDIRSRASGMKPVKVQAIK